MSINSRLVLMIHNDSSIYRLLLIGLLVASPALHYLCYNNTFDPPYLRSLSSVLCLLTLGVSSFISNHIVYKASLYITIVSFVVVNNNILLTENDFAPIYTFSSVIVFMGMVFLCKQRREFAGITILNTGAVLAAYFTAKHAAISITSLIILLATFTTIAYITFTVRKVYRQKFKKAVDNLTRLNHTLMLNEQKLRESRNQLHAIINSINDIVFEMDENKNCLNVWYNEMLPLHFDPKKMLTHRLRILSDLKKPSPLMSRLIM
jgi:two-component system sensor histidine kinase/response regulator